MRDSKFVSARHIKSYAFSSVVIAGVIAASRPAMLSKVYAADNQYQWTKQVDQNLLGGYYTSVASSADGSHLIIGSAEGGEGYNEASPLYVSSNYGNTWTNVTHSTEDRIRYDWKSVDVSNDGQIMVAASDYGVNLDTFNSTDGSIFISQDAGTTWDEISPGSANDWKAIAISGDGSRLVAVANDSHDTIYVSDDAGANWAARTVAHDVSYWETVSISDNGNKILVGGENQGDYSSAIYFSDDEGANWTNISPDNGDLVFVSRTAMSADGNKIAVSSTAYNGDTYDAVYVSTDDGANWEDVKPDTADIDSWRAIAMSDDGNVLSVQADDDKMYITQDGGANWSEEDPGQADDDFNYWRSIDLNNSGSRIVTSSSQLAYVGYNATLDGSPVSIELANPENGTAITLTTPDGTTITCHTAVKESGLSAEDGAYSYPVGLVDFCFSGASASNQITIDFVTDLLPNQVVVRKYNPSNKSYATVAGASVSETTLGGKHALRVTYTLADNGPLDTNPATGEVADPVGIAVAEVTPPNTGLEMVRKLHQISIITAVSGAGIAASTALAKLRKRSNK